MEKRKINVNISFLGLLQTALIVLKIMGYITASWWVVFAPMWVPFALVCVAALCFFAIFVLVAFLKLIFRK
jgi:hypothetical protein